MVHVRGSSSLAFPRPGARASLVRRKDIVQFGDPTGCKGCRMAKAGGTQQMQKAHCRERMMTELIGRRREEQGEEGKRSSGIPGASVGTTDASFRSG